MFAIPNLSPFCCKLETWLRMAAIPYELVETGDPRVAPRKKLPFIEESGVRMADSSLIIEHLSRSRSIDLDAKLSARERATALLVKRTLEEHYGFVLAYTHLIREEGTKHTNSRFDTLPLVLRPIISRIVQKNVKNLLWQQGLLRCEHSEIVGAALEDWRAVLSLMSDGPFFFGEHATNIDATVFGMLAPTVFTPIDTPIRAFLRSEQRLMAYATRMRERFFPELAQPSTPRVDTVAVAASV